MTDPASTDAPGRRVAPRRRRLGAILVNALLAGVLVASLVVSGRIGAVAWGGHDETRLVSEQVRWLEPLAENDTPAAMDHRFPQGGFLQVVLTGLAVARDGGRPPQDRLPVVRRALARAESPELAGVPAVSPATGAFVAGWTLLLETEVARLSGAAADRTRLQGRAAEARLALEASRTGLLGTTSSDQVSPLDTVVLVAGLRAADDLVGVPGAPRTIADWLRRIEPLRDPGSKLLPHRLDGTGRVVEGPRASSQALIQVFWPAIDPTTSSRDWVAYENTFLCARLGLVAVCEYPGGGGGGDVGSGPLVFGVSVSATAITLAAARAHGNGDLAREISREAELFGVPRTGDGGRRYLDGDVPLADAALAWARSVPVAPELAGVDDRDGVAWPAWMLGALVPAVVAGGALLWRLAGRGHRLSGPLEGDAEPPEAPSFPGTPVRSA